MGIEKKEEVADIVSELRDNSRWLSDVGEQLVTKQSIATLLGMIADRLEAAWKREKAEIEADALNAGAFVEAERHKKCGTPTTEKSSAVGNAAATREALIALRDAARNFYHQILNSKYNDIMDEYKCRERGFPALLDLRYAIPKANAALAAPARNCDVGTADDQEERFTKVCTANSKDGVRGLCSETCPFGRDYQSGCALAWSQEPYTTEGGAE